MATKYAFWPGCVSKGAAPELYLATNRVAKELGIELVELDQATCTGAGVIQEQAPELADALNARTFAMAQQLNLPLMNICSTCQGIESMVQDKLAKNPEYLDKINAILAEEGLHYTPGLEVKNFLWVLVEDFGLDRLKSMVKHPLTGVRIGPFYGCYILRPSDILGKEEHPGRDKYLEQVIEAVGATPVDYEGAKKCCGFPILTINRENSLKQAGNHIHEAQDLGADALVSPCPLCHLNLDAQQPAAKSVTHYDIELPIIHLPQMIGLALGVDPKEMRMDHHVVSTQKLLSKLSQPVGA
ncbi:MAG TPA: CoB--CoM heterodisulfide reductase iron-sulfur subunit B family protein [Dehalococcoidia bacterium]|jgi:succinate dehydrogenase / fumarate reductase cytochrome b subunit|nr:CoB--CoM heterodisulfide reductase iron-sulfur subunit B family protein [Dehalococcoidia bacterium]